MKQKAIILTLFSVLFFISCNQTENSQSEVRIVDRPSISSENQFYIGNKEPLRAAYFIKLPVGHIKPHGWLKRYLELQRDGLTGRLHEISAWLEKDNNAWLDTGSDWGWEEVPYWLKGYGNIAYILDDPKMLEETKIWIEAAFSSRQADGYFGPINERHGKRELWANMIMLWCLQSYYEYSGDQRVIDLMTNYFKWQMTVPDELFLEDYWENSRGGDNLYSVYWLYNITGEAFLLDLAHKIHQNTANWRQESTLPNWHNVNIAQCFREPATYFMLSKDSAHLAATYNNYYLIRRTFGQVPGGMFGADENARMGYIDPRQGTETCGFVEQMASDEILLRYTGDLLWAENCEDVAFNSFPAAVMPDFKALRYITSPNQVLSDGENHHPGIDNRGQFMTMNPFSSRCCQHNHTQGWPYFVENLILATPDNGVGVAIYSACEAKIKVGNGVEIQIIEETQYPFNEKIEFKIQTPQNVQFPFYLGLPSWTNNKAILKINGKKCPIELKSGKYACINREWKNNDVVSLIFPMEFSLRTWQVNQNSVSVNYGPLTLALNIEEEYTLLDPIQTALGDSKWAKNADPSQWPAYCIVPQTPWNYALVLDKNEYSRNLHVVKRAWPADDFPFTQENSPLMVKAKGRRIPSWTLDQYKLCGLIPPENSAQSDILEDILLVPMGTARLRISAFPVSYE